MEIQLHQWVYTPMDEPVEGLCLINLPNRPLVYVGSLYERRPGAVKLGEALDRRDLCFTG